MTLEKLISNQMEIDKKVEQIGLDNDLDVAFDGAISPKDYLESKYKTMWIFKEPSEASGMHGSDYKKAIYLDLEKPKHKNIYFDPMRFVEYSINNNFAEYNKSHIWDEEVYATLKNLCFINYSKFIGGNSQSVDFSTRVFLFENILKEQIEKLKPKIIVSCSKANWFLEYTKGVLAIDNEHVITIGTTLGYKKNDGTIVIFCYHPERQNQEVYVNEKISIIKEFGLG